MRYLDCDDASPCYSTSLVCSLSRSKHIQSPQVLRHVRACHTLGTNLTQAMRFPDINPYTHEWRLGARVFDGSRDGTPSAMCDGGVLMRSYIGAGRSIMDIATSCSPPCENE